MNNGVLSATKECLIFLIVHAEVSNEQNGLMEQFLAVLLVQGCLHRVEKNVIEEVIELLLNLILTHNLLCEAVVHAENMVDDLY